MIFNKNEKVPLGTTGGLETVAVRMPDDEIARELILQEADMYQHQVPTHPEDRARRQHSMWQRI